MRTNRGRVAALTALTVIALVVLAAPAPAGAHQGGHADHRRSSWHDRHASNPRHAAEVRKGGHDRHRHHRGHRPGEAVQVVADGLNAPFGLTIDGKDLYVAEADATQVTHVNLRNGKKRPAVTDIGASSVTTVGHHLVIVTGAEAPPEEGPPPEESPVADAADASPLAPGMSVFRAKPGGSPHLVADLLAFELENNPDGQLQFDPETGAPVDALSNPFDVLAYGWDGAVLVADAGANAVLKVSKRGRVSTFFVPPLITTGACAGLPNNDPEHAGCDPVPTGLAYGPNNTLYVSTLTAEVPGEGRVYVLDARNGKVRRVIGGFDGPTGVAVDGRGTLYVSEVLHNVPTDDGPPPPGFDPASVGRIVKVAGGKRTYAAVTMPTGLAFHDGHLYASAWSIAGFLGMTDAGQVVKVSDRAFKAAPPVL